MKLEVGEYYLSAGGEIVQIEHMLNQVENIYLDGSDNNYSEDGKCKGDWREFDLIAHISKELHKHILNEINTYYTDKDFKEVVDSVWGK